MTITHGFTEPRVWTKPLVDLTSKTSRGFEVIEFAEDVLRVHLFPWQKWLLIHLMELDSFGLLRFRKALIIVGRQNGKTLLAAVLAAYWLYVDAGRWPAQLPEQNFIVVGAAQKLDIAMKPWKQVRRWGAPDDVKVGIAIDRVPDLQEITYPPRTTNGETELRTFAGAAYLPRTFDGARGQSAARLILDELREQYDYEGWSAIEKSANAMYDSMLVAFSNAGTRRSAVLRGVRETAHSGVDDAETQWFVAEWSAEQDAALDDPRAFAQANPSAGYLPGMSIAGLMRAAAEAPEKNVERIEVLGQWVTALIDPFMSGSGWELCADAPAFDADGRQTSEGSQIAEGSHMLIGIDTSWNRSMTYVSVAGYRDDGLIHVEIVRMRAGMLWVVPEVARLAKEQGITHVAVQSRGCPASDFVQPLKDAGLEVVEIFGTTMLNSAGRFRDRVRDQLLRHRGQPILDMAIADGVSKRLSGLDVWDRAGSVVDVAPAVAVTNAVLGLETTEKAQPVLSAYAVADGETQADWW